MLILKLVFGWRLNQTHISVSLNNVQPMYYQPWSVTLSVRDKGLLDREQLAFKGGQEQRQELLHTHPGCNKTFREKVMNQQDFSHTKIINEHKHTNRKLLSKIHVASDDKNNVGRRNLLLPEAGGRNTWAGDFCKPTRICFPSSSFIKNGHNFKRFLTQMQKQNSSTATPTPPPNCWIQQSGS